MVRGYSTGKQRGHRAAGQRDHPHGTVAVADEVGVGGVQDDPVGAGNSRGDGGGGPAPYGSSPDGVVVDARPVDVGGVYGGAEGRGLIGGDDGRGTDAVQRNALDGVSEVGREVGVLGIDQAIEPVSVLAFDQ